MPLRLVESLPRLRVVESLHHVLPLPRALGARARGGSCGWCYVHARGEAGLEGALLGLLLLLLPPSLLLLPLPLAAPPLRPLDKLLRGPIRHAAAVGARLEGALLHLAHVELLLQPRRLVR